jgi:hypothetical protein
MPEHCPECDANEREHRLRIDTDVIACQVNELRNTLDSMEDLHVKYGRQLINELRGLRALICASYLLRNIEPVIVEESDRRGLVDEIVCQFREVRGHVRDA